MKCLVLGDSHTASVKFAWDDLQATHPGTQLDFFALPVQRIRNLKVDGAHLALRPNVRKGDQDRLRESFPEGRIDLSVYDAVLLTGLLEPLHPLILAHAHTHLASHVPPASKGLFRKSGGIPEGKTVATRAAFEAAWDAHFEASKAGVITRRVAKLNAPKCHLAINPLLSARAATSRTDLGRAYAGAVRDNIAATLMQIATEGLARNLPDAITLLAQPDHTIVSGCMTDTRFMTGAEKYYGDGDQFGRADVFHANRLYGSLILEAFFERLSQPKAKGA